MEDKRVKEKRWKDEKIALRLRSVPKMKRWKATPTAEQDDAPASREATVHIISKSE